MRRFLIYFLNIAVILYSSIITANAEAATILTEGMPIKYILIVILIAAGVAFIVTAFMRMQLKSVRWKSGASDYIRDDSMVITHKRDRFMYQRVDKTRRANSND